MERFSFVSAQVRPDAASNTYYYSMTSHTAWLDVASDATTLFHSISVRILRQIVAPDSHDNSVSSPTAWLDVASRKIILFYRKPVPMLLI